MASPIPALSPTCTKAQALAWLGNFKNKYHNEAKTPYEGMTGAQIYAYLAKQHPTATPYDLAQAAAELLVSSATGSTIGGTIIAGGNTLGNSTIGVEEGVQGLASSWEGGLASFLSALTSRNTWIRVAKVVIGGVLVILGISHMTGASNVVTKAVENF